MGQGVEQHLHIAGEAVMTIVKLLTCFWSVSLWIR